MNKNLKFIRGKFSTIAATMANIRGKGRGGLRFRSSSGGGGLCRTNVWEPEHLRWWTSGGG